MKTKELIRQLKAIDPKGTAEVVVGTEAIWYPELMEGYYDGAYLRVQRDAHERCVGATVTRRGWKIRLRTLGVDSLIEIDPDMSFEYENLAADQERRWRDRVEYSRASMKQIIESMDSYPERLAPNLKEEENDGNKQD